MGMQENVLWSTQVRRIELLRATASGVVAPSLVSELLAACDLEGVSKLRCAEGLLPNWDAKLLGRLAALRVLNLSGCALSSLPAGDTLTSAQKYHKMRALMLVIMQI